jgi:hypothetical protein
MTLEEQAASLSRNEIARLLVSQQGSIDEVTAENAKLKQQLEWFKRQLFGSKSERRLLSPDARQLGLGEPFATTSPGPVPTITVPSHSRRRSRPAWEKATDDTELRFDDSVPVKEIRIPNPEIEDLPPDSYSVVDTKKSYRLAQEPGAYVVLRYVRDVVKLKKEGTFSCPPAPPTVLEKCFADVSLLAGILIDKFRYHRVPRNMKGARSAPECVLYER